MNCTAKITVGILSTVTSILTGCVFMVIFLIGSILLKPEKITGDEKNNFQILCICLCVFCALVFAFMLYASWAKGKPYRIGQIVVCALFFVLYIVLVSFISGPVDIILDAASNLWHSKSYNGSYSHFENAFKCCGYVETPDRCYAKSTSLLYDLTVWETAQFNLQDSSTKRNKIDYFSTNVYDCRQALLDFIDDNFNIFVPLAVLFMLYVLSTGIFFIILLCFELDEKIEAESDDPFENSEDSFFSSSYSKSFNTESEFDRCIKSVGSSPLINGLDSAVETQFTDRETGSQTCRPQSEASAYSGASKVIMLGPAIDQSGVVTQAPT
ncbi:hypothetical protein TRFO_10118 [Tritrichomonas foetus]|uniref:Tetraspanin family protein n=1 Tax=Tritrichomonas foetus TaxID=1144522 RepID=A0A1J4JFF6_9EUKA|nr:hypothetical protein TRFO_10118 [Tritrichomonas foetus]|eukprot:OHS96189.1 hypothetical protein TRFO_10118 [Tritrichomonas foetus]